MSNLQFLNALTRQVSRFSVSLETVRLSIKIGFSQCSTPALISLISRICKHLAWYYNSDIILVCLDLTLGCKSHWKHSCAGFNVRTLLNATSDVACKFIDLQHCSGLRLVTLNIQSAIYKACSNFLETEISSYNLLVILNQMATTI